MDDSEDSSSSDEDGHDGASDNESATSSSRSSTGPRHEEDNSLTATDFLTQYGDPDRVLEELRNSTLRRNDPNAADDDNQTTMADRLGSPHITSTPGTASPQHRAQTLDERLFLLEDDNDAVVGDDAEEYRANRRGTMQSLNALRTRTSDLSSLWGALDRHRSGESLGGSERLPLALSDHYDYAEPLSTTIEMLAPAARFSMREKHGRRGSSTTIKFDPPISSKFILVKMWNPKASGNIDIQNISAYGYSGHRWFPSIEVR